MKRIWENFPLAIEQDVIYNLRMKNDLEPGSYYYARMRMRTGVCINFVHEGVPSDNTIPNMLGLDSGELKEQILNFNYNRPDTPVELQQRIHH